jgi:putative peptidoglycan lipid II flippase
MLAFVLSGVLGLVRQIVLSGIFGAGMELDAFYAALRVPETLFTLVAGGALGSAFIPVFSRFLNEDKFNAAWQLASSVMSLVVLAATLAAGIGFLLAVPIVDTLLVPSASAESRALTVELMRIMLVTVVLFGVSGLMMGILNAHQRFTAPAFAPTMYNVGIIGGAALLTPLWGVHGLAWGAVIGAGLHLGVQIPTLRRLPNIHLRPNPSLKPEGVVNVLSLMGPRLLGLMVVQVNFWVNAALTSGMDEGSLTSLTIAFTLMFTVLGVLGQSLGTAIFPTLTAHFARQDWEGFRGTLRSALDNVIFLSLPAGLGMAVLGGPMIAVLFQRGEWSADATTATAWALIFYGIGLTGHAALEILARSFYALHDTWTPVVVGGSAMLLNIILSVVFMAVFSAFGASDFPRGPFAGLALANTLATALESTILWFLLQRRVPDLSAKAIVFTLSRTSLAALGMAAVVLAWLALDLPLLIEFAGGIILGVFSFGGLALLLRIPAAQAVPRQILARLR